MIDQATLNKYDVGRTVTYHRQSCRMEYGVLSSWSDRYVFVRFTGPNGQACEPADVSFNIAFIEGASTQCQEAVSEQAHQ